MFVIFASFISHFPIPQCLHEYYCRAWTVVSKHHICTYDVICVMTISLTFIEVHEAAKGCCSCRETVPMHHHGGECTNYFGCTSHREINFWSKFIGSLRKHGLLGAHW